VKVVMVFNLVWLILGTIFGWAFIIRYHLNYPWRLNNTGRHIMSWSMIATMFYTLYLVRTIADFDSAPGSAPTVFNLVRFALFTAFTYVIVQRYFKLHGNIIEDRIRALDETSRRNEGADETA